MAPKAAARAVKAEAAAPKTAARKATGKGRGRAAAAEEDEPAEEPVSTAARAGHPTEDAPSRAKPASKSSGRVAALAVAPPEPAPPTKAFSLEDSTEVGQLEHRDGPAWRGGAVLLSVVGLARVRRVAWRSTAAR